MHGHHAGLRCTLLARWDEGTAAPWFILTDLGLRPKAATRSWYAMRAWQEQDFKIGKRGGCQWQYTRMTDPQRAEQAMLAIPVTTLGAWTLGTHAEEALGKPLFPDLPDLRYSQHQDDGLCLQRSVSLMRKAFAMVLRSMNCGEALRPIELHPNGGPPWSPATPSNRPHESYEEN